MAVEFRRVHALNFGNASLVLATELNASRVFEDISPFGEVIDKEVAGRVTGALIIPKTILVLVLGENVDRFGAASPLVLEMDLFQVAVDTQLNANN